MFKWLKNFFSGATEVAAGAVGHVQEQAPYKVETPKVEAAPVKADPIPAVAKLPELKKPGTPAKKPQGQRKGRKPAAKPQATKQPAKPAAKKTAPKKA